MIDGYDLLAREFLRRNRLLFKATYKNSDAPPWYSEDGKHNCYGHCYRIMFKRLQGDQRHTLSFDFWGSYNDSLKNKTPTPYDVLACISFDANCPDTFELFCGEYGYDQDSIKAEQTFQRASKFAKRLQHFFSEQELNELGNIR